MIYYLQMTNLINPLHHVYMKQFKQYVAGRGGKVCAIVEDGDGKTYTIGDRKYLFSKLKELDDSDRRKSRDWIPSDRSLPLLPMPLSELINTVNSNKMKSVASAYVNHFLEAGQKLGTVNNKNLRLTHQKMIILQCSFYVWEMSVPVEHLHQTGFILAKAGYYRPDIKMERIVPWKSLEKMSSLANGPGKQFLLMNMPWSSALLVLIELILVGMGLSCEDYFDRDVIYSNKRKSADNLKPPRKLMKNKNSDDDFMTVEKSKKPKTVAKKAKCVASSKPKSGHSALTTPESCSSTGPTSASRPRSVISEGPVYETGTMVSRPSVIMNRTSNHQAPAQSNFQKSTLAFESESDTESDELEPLTPPLKRNPKVTISKQLAEKEISSQNKTPPRNSQAQASPRPTSHCLFDWHTDTSDITLSDYKPGCLVQLIGLNNTSRHSPCNVRLSDGHYWLDVDVADKLRIYFVGDMVKLNDIFVIQKTEGTNKDKNFKLVAFVRPEWAQFGGVRHGEPVPLLQDTVSLNRGGRQAGIVPLLSSMSSFDEDAFENLLNDDPTKMILDDPFEAMTRKVTNDDSEHDEEEPEHDTEDPIWVFTKKPTLSQMLRTDIKQPTIADTPLVNLKLKVEDVRKQAMSKKVFENAEHLHQIKYDESEPYFDGLSVSWKVPSEFQDGEYKVNITWPQLMPRTERSWTKTYTIGCSCPGFKQHGPKKHCKHISFIMLKHFCD